MLSVESSNRAATRTEDGRRHVVWTMLSEVSRRSSEREMRGLQSIRDSVHQQRGKS
jgi:hypothetical protein